MGSEMCIRDRSYTAIGVHFKILATLVAGVWPALLIHLPYYRNLGSDLVLAGRTFNVERTPRWPSVSSGRELETEMIATPGTGHCVSSVRCQQERPLWVLRAPGSSVKFFGAIAMRAGYINAGRSRIDWLQNFEQIAFRWHGRSPVSYTHLTLPTIYSV